MERDNLQKEQDQAQAEAAAAEQEQAAAQTEPAQTEQEAADAQTSAEETPAEEVTAEETPAEETTQEPAKETGKKDPKDLQIEELKDKVIRQMAEFDNYRKRTEREKAQNYDIGASDFIIKILPIVDNFERGLESMSEEEKETSYVQGFNMIYKQLKKVLDEEGVVEIEALGKEFDPLFHNAVMQQPSDEYESGTIMQVYRKGYMYKDRVLRHSMVIVAQ